MCVQHVNYKGGRSSLHPFYSHIASQDEGGKESLAYFFAIQSACWYVKNIFPWHFENSLKCSLSRSGCYFYVYNPIYHLLFLCETKITTALLIWYKISLLKDHKALGFLFIIVHVWCECVEIKMQFSLLIEDEWILSHILVYCFQFFSTFFIKYIT